MELGNEDFDGGGIAAQRLCLLLCGTLESRERHGDEIGRLVAEADPQRLADEMARQRLLPLLGTRLVAEHGELLAPTFTERVEHATALARRRAALFDVAAERAREALADDGIAALPLKGPTLARSLYGDPAMRSAIDLDLLVPTNELGGAVEVLLDHGYRPPLDPVDRTSGLPRLHFHLDHVDGTLPPVELHWRVHWHEERFSQDMLTRSDPGAQGLHAKPEDELTSLLLFFARDGFVGLRLPADIAAWWDRHASEIDGPALQLIANTYPALRPSLQVAAAVAKRWVGLPAEELLVQGPTSRREKVASRLANHAVRGDRDQVGADMTLVDWLLSPPGRRASAAARWLTPPAAELRRMYGLSGGSHLGAFFRRLSHPPKLLARYALALWRTRKAPG